MGHLIDVDEFATLRRAHPVLDVRTPTEFTHGHVPGAHNLPLFTDAERAAVGTSYADAGRRAAMFDALDAVGPKLRSLVETVDGLVSDRDVLMYCWRGGMRSESVAWLLSFFDYRVQRLDGGYKAFRRFVRDSFVLQRPLRVLGGLTGSGKTDVLHALRARGAQVIDLEAIARHRGSVFGGLGQPTPPSQQQFENDLAMQWRSLDPHRPVWLEDESRRIGEVGIPDALFDQLQAAETLVLDVPDEARLDRLTALYGASTPSDLHDALDCIRKRLGGLRTQQAHAAIATGHLRRACRIILSYYDDAYRHGLSQRADGTVHVLHTEASNPERIADQVLTHALSPMA